MVGLTGMIVPRTIVNVTAKMGRLAESPMLQTYSIWWSLTFEVFVRFPPSITISWVKFFLRLLAAVRI